MTHVPDATGSADDLRDDLDRLVDEGGPITLAPLVIRPVQRIIDNLIQRIESHDHVDARDKRAIREAREFLGAS